MKTTLFALTLITFLTLGDPLPARCAAHYKGPELESLPDAARKTIKTQSRGSKLLCIDPSIDNGQIVYTVELKKSGHDFSFVVDDDGTLVRVQVALAETPASVQAAIKTELAGGSVDCIDKVPDEDAATYDVEITRSGRDRSFTVSEDGNIVDREVFLEELPEAIQKAVKAQAKGGRLGDIKEVYEDEEMTYSVNLTRHRKAMPFSLDDEGNLVNAVVALEETPAAVQKAIQGKLADAYIEQITLYIKSDKKTYTVTFTRADAVDSFEVTSEGKIIKTDEPADGVPRIGL